MFRSLALLFTTIFCLCAHILPAAAQNPPEIILGDTDTTAEADADKISSQLDTMGNNIKACVRTHQAEARECMCKFTDDNDRLKVLYDQVLRLHPDWEGKIVSYKKGTAPTTSVDFSSLKVRFDFCSDLEKSQ